QRLPPGAGGNGPHALRLKQSADGLMPALLLVGEQNGEPIAVLGLDHKRGSPRTGGWEANNKGCAGSGEWAGERKSLWIFSLRLAVSIEPRRIPAKSDVRTKASASVAADDSSDYRATMPASRLVIICLIVCSITGTSSGATALRPNVVFILADQWRAAATGYAGDPNVKTPNLDRLEAASVNFINAVSGYPVCSPC